MDRQIFKSKFWLIILLCFVFILSSPCAFAQHGGHGGHGGGGHGGWSHDNWGHSDRGWWDFGYHHPRGYHWYNNSWWLGDTIVAGLVIGATISALPSSYSIVYVGRTPYYYDGMYYYRAAPAGYVVVNPPVAPVAVVSPAPATTVVTQPQTGLEQVITINVPNSKGSYTQVQLTKYKDGYLGPQGEYYPGNPSVDQLKVLYGK